MRVRRVAVARDAHGGRGAQEGGALVKHRLGVRGHGRGPYLIGFDGCARNLASMDFDLAIGIQVAQSCSGNLSSVFSYVRLPKVELRREIRQGHKLGVAQRERLDACQRQVLGCRIPRQCACLHQLGVGERGWENGAQMRGGRRALRRARLQDSTQTAPISMPRPLQPTSRMLLTCQGQRARKVSAAGRKLDARALRRQAPSTRRSDRCALRRRLCGRNFPQVKCCVWLPGRKASRTVAQVRARGAEASSATKHLHAAHGIVPEHVELPAVKPLVDVGLHRLRHRVTFCNRLECGHSSIHTHGSQ